MRAQGADCVIEVEELHEPDPLPTEGFDPTRAVRGALRRAHKQLRGCKHLPTGIVVFSDAFFRTVSVGTVAAAAFGPGFQEGRDYDPLSTLPQAFRFPRRQECPVGHPELAHPLLSRTDNKSVSCVMLLSRYSVAEFKLAAWQARQARGETLPTGIQEELHRRFRDTDRFRNDVLHTRIVVIENPHANHISPHLFRGPFDQRWTWQGDWLTASWVGDSTKQCLASGVPFDVF